jgi:hypothetical protein
VDRNLKLSQNAFEEILGVGAPRGTRDFTPHNDTASRGVRKSDKKLGQGFNQFVSARLNRCEAWQSLNSRVLGRAYYI